MREFGGVHGDFITEARSRGGTRSSITHVVRLEFSWQRACGAALRAARIGQDPRIQMAHSNRGHLYSRVWSDSSGPPQAGGPQAVSVIPSVYLRRSVPP